MVDSNQKWTWKGDFLSSNDGKKLTDNQKNLIKKMAIEKGYLIEVPVVKTTIGNTTYNLKSRSKLYLRRFLNPKRFINKSLFPCHRKITYTCFS